MRRCADHKRIIVAILIAALSILCAFYGNDSISEVHHTEQVCLQKSQTAISDTTLRNLCVHQDDRRKFPVFCNVLLRIDAWSSV